TLVHFSRIGGNGRNSDVFVNADTGNVSVTEVGAAGASEISTGSGKLTILTGAAGNFTLGTGVILSAGGDVTISAGGLEVAAPIASTSGNVTVTGSGAISVRAPITGLTASVFGGSTADSISVSSTGATPLTVDGRGGGDSIIVNFGSLQN